MSLKIPSARQQQRDRRSLPYQLALQDHNYVSKIPPTPSPPPPPPLSLPLQPTKELRLYNPVLESYKEQFPKNQCDLSSQPSSTEIEGLIEEIILPEEVWMLIWSYLDFNIVQKICSCVSKAWLEMIRSSKLSWEMKLRQTFSFLAVTDFDAILFHWENLRVLHFSSEPDFARFRLSVGLNSHKSLEKIVIPHWSGFFTKGSYLDHTLWGFVTKCWIDPSHILTPHTVRNAFTLKIYIGRLPEEIAMEQNGCDLTQLETLEICQYPDSENSYDIAKTSEKNLFSTKMLRLNKLLFKFKDLKNLSISLAIHIDFLLDIVRLLGNTKTTQNISAYVEVRSNYDQQGTEKIFNEALKIVSGKFPFPARRILELNFFEVEDYTDTSFPRGTKYFISYGKSGATLTKSDYNSDSEYENSDSMNESVEDYDSLDESVENSDSFGESNENSDSMDESDEDSDNEDHMSDPDHDYWNNGMIN